jgi:CubicO group peptidase (beta-lactamase class C family)
VVKHWPEFGRHGKEELTVADVLRHEAGLPFLSRQLNIEHRSAAGQTQ